MNFADRTVSRTFREGLGRECPALADNPTYWRMTGHLLFGTRRDADTKLLMLPAELLASMEERTPGGNYSGTKFLDAFRADVLDFQVEEHVWSPRADLCRCRAVKSITLPPTVETLLQEERRRQKDGLDKTNVRVWLSTGSVYLPRHATARRKAQQCEAEAAAQEDYVNPNTQMLLAYLNSLPPNRFTSALKHIPEAMEAAENLADNECEYDGPSWQAVIEPQQREPFKAESSFHVWAKDLDDDGCVRCTRSMNERKRFLVAGRWTHNSSCASSSRATRANATAYSSACSRRARRRSRNTQTRALARAS